jgi:hypothetical protein
MFNGEVYAFPLPPNWPLLVFCQLMLAAPIVIFWMFLRRRKKASGAASPRHGAVGFGRT